MFSLISAPFGLNIVHLKSFSIEEMEAVLLTLANPSSRRFYPRQCRKIDIYLKCTNSDILSEKQ